jgi:hypothetical protein
VPSRVQLRAGDLLENLTCWSTAAHLPEVGPAAAARPSPQ